MKLKNKVWQDPIFFIAFGFGSGLISIAPGTWGTLFAIPIYLLLANLSPVIYLSLIFIGFLMGVLICNHVSKDLGIHDHSGIVWDEIIGYLITMTALPLNIYWIIAGFFLFRLFDIWKPQPIRYIDEHVKGGLGIMLDDVLAAIPPWCILQLLHWKF